MMCNKSFMLPGVLTFQDKDSSFMADCIGKVAIGLGIVEVCDIILEMVCL